jgi:hypothetical protein
MYSLPINPSPIELWEEFKIRMAEDFVFHGNSQEAAIDKTLQHIDSIFSCNGQTLTDFGLPIPTLEYGRYTDAINNNRQMTQQQYQDASNTLVNSMNADQKVY